MDTQSQGLGDFSTPQQIKWKDLDDLTSKCKTVEE
jgi:hypothetical protein